MLLFSAYKNMGSFAGRNWVLPFLARFLLFKKFHPEIRVARLRIAFAENDRVDFAEVVEKEWVRVEEIYFLSL